MPLALSMLCRDEADIIEANLLHHAALGVENFVVTDLGSTDGTREILARLSGQIDLQIFDDSAQGVDPDIRMTRMAQWLQQRRGADRILHVDPDEFFVSSGPDLDGTISQALHHLGGTEASSATLMCERFNRIPSHEALTNPEYTFCLHNWQVEETLQLPQQRPWGRDDDHLLVRRLSQRAITQRQGLHLAANGGVKLPAVVEVPDALICVLRFPIRGYAQFERSVINHGSGTCSASRHSQFMTRQYSHWYDAWLDGRLGIEYDRLFFNEQELDMLRQAGIVSRAGPFLPAGASHYYEQEWRKAS